MATERNLQKTERCRVCKEPMNPGATRCTACHSYQNWRRYFDVSAVVLSLLVALVSVVSAVGPQIFALLPPWGSHLEIKSYYFSTNTVSLIVENSGNKPGYIGKVTVVVYCKGAFFPSDPLAADMLNVDAEHTPSKWGFMLDLGTSKETSRTIPARSSREISFILSGKRLRESAEDFDKDTRYPLGDFNTVLYNESVRIHITAELLDYGHKFLKPVTVSETPDPPFWKGFTTITQDM
jgi:hypothetical protein